MKTVEERAREIAERVGRECYLHSPGGDYSGESNFDVDDAAEILASDIARAEEKGRREIADIVINAVLDIETTPRENWPSARDLLAKITQDCGLQSEVFPLLNMCRAKEAGGDGPEAKTY